ncbi:CP family cyanate transporter-like MFS transporter [Pseudomonas duriflava]|uniref:CP family cyanate transporter-like MFS transporter n=1 Tax=Pseudomonas duriflava TaxID=459528 RepID=A0A562Q9Z1_9PSED|nr:CynX/NimT family MFS transporter [Pseudomonas duriflava]TWI53533.1 CP family cyanate transporter-like MFS transporter [Pseudomonas duriflava]
MPGLSDTATDTHTLTPARPWLLLLGLFLVALNLRPALSSLSPLLRQIEAETGLSSAAAGLLTTAPVLCLGLFAPLAARLSNRIGSEKTVLITLIVLAGGILLRSLFPPAGLFAGSVMAGACIGIIGVLLPGIIKRDFPNQAGQLMGVYTMALCMGAALAAGATAPLGAWMDHHWQPALGAWALLALIAAIVWLPQIRATHHTHRQRWQVTGLWTDRLAWQVTLYMGLQSSLAYIVFGWLPSILIDRGLTTIEAGLALSGSILIQLISALATPWLATRGRDQRLTVVIVISLTLAGLLGCLYGPLPMLWLWTLLLGLGQGGTFSIALALIVLRSPNAHVAARLSGMSQGVGYTLAALGPFLVGLIHDLTHGWNGIGLLFILISVAALLFGIQAGRDRHVQAQSTPL